MRRFLYLIVFFAVSNTAHGSKTVSGVVAVSTGPMQAYTQSIGRDLAAGDDVFLNDEVETGETTRAQVLLRDESVFSLAPSSKVLFDEFVYDPMGGEGVLEASLLSGGMRFVSGQLSKNQSENIKIKAGKATVGIRGTEIMAKHGEQGTTFVLLSGAMEIATESGRQLIDRSGYGIDISNDGMLGIVRQVPLAEINAILSPPAKKEESKSGDSEASSDENGEESEGAEGEEEDTASASEGESEGEAETSADASSESGSEGQETASSDTAPAQSDSASDDDSSFDAALTASVSSSEGENEVAVAGLSDMAATSADNVSTGVTAELPQAEDVEPLTIDIAGDIVDSVVSSLAEDDQQEQADQLLQSNISLELISKTKLTDKPFYSSSASVLVRSSLDFKDYADGKYDVTHALLREKFPNSFDANGIMHHAMPQSSVIDLSGYDAIFVYLDSDAGGEEFSGSEEAAYRDFIHSDNKKVLMIGDQRENASNTGSGDFPTINSAMGVYNQNAPNGFEYSAVALQVQTPMALDLNPANQTSELLAGVSSFEQYYDENFESFNFIHGGVGTNTNAMASVDNALLTSSNTDIPALDFGAKGAVFFGRWTCTANNSINGEMGASILANSVSNGREQFCRNLISSIAPDSTLVDVEVGTLSVPGETAGTNYRLISGHGNEFSVIGDKLILNGGADLSLGTYELVFGVTLEDANEVTRTLSIDVKGGNAEKRHIVTRDTYNVGETVSFSTENLVTDTGYLAHATKNSNNVSWVSIGSVSGGGTPSNTGVITLHYRIDENGSTYDRFHEIDIVHDCTSDHCESFATSMDTANDLAFGRDFDASDRATWDSFFQRFSEGVGHFANSRTIQSSNLTGNYDHDLSVNFGMRSAILNTGGAINGATINNTWNFDVVAPSGPCDNNLCTLQHLETVELPYNLTVNLLNIALPNGKHSMMIKTSLAEGGVGVTADYVPMTPQ
jgi:hypothetical protein